MTYQIVGLEPTEFKELFGLSAEALSAHGAERHVVDAKPGAPCRISLDDADIGETVLLLNYLHQPAATPYRQAGPIFVRECAPPRFEAANQVPPALAVRTLSVRAFDVAGQMVDADLVEGAALEGLIARFWANPKIAYAHAHYARRGCFAAEIKRL